MEVCDRFMAEERLYRVVFDGYARVLSSKDTLIIQKPILLQYEPARPQT